MRNRRRILLLAGLVALVLAGALIWLASRPREPVYNGKTLSEWLTPGTGGQLDAGTEEAVRHIGTNAIPTLLRMLRERDSKPKILLLALAEKQRLVKFHFAYAAQRNWETTAAFQILGPAASNAVPDLIQIFDERVSVYSQISAIFSLGYIGPAANAAVPRLVRALGDTNEDPEVRDGAIGALAAIHADPGLVVPALIKCLNDSDLVVRLDAAGSLRSFGSAARTAVPALIGLLKDPDANMRNHAEQALKAIDPEAAAKAGVQ